MDVYIHAKLQNFMELFPTVTAYCYITHGYLVNFYLSLEKHEELQYICNTMTDLCKIWQGDSECVSEVHTC